MGSFPVAATNTVSKIYGWMYVSCGWKHKALTAWSCPAVAVTAGGVFGLEDRINSPVSAYVVVVRPARYDIRKSFTQEQSTIGGECRDSLFGTCFGSIHDEEAESESETS